MSNIIDLAKEKAKREELNRATNEIISGCLVDAIIETNTTDFLPTFTLTINGVEAEMEVGEDTVTISPVKYEE